MNAKIMQLTQKGVNQISVINHLIYLRDDVSIFDNDIVYSPTILHIL